jgi:superfamily II DNA or RNA helicase
MGRITAIKVNETHFFIKVDDGDLLYEIDSAFAIYKEGYQFVPAYKNHTWDGKVHFFKVQSRRFPIGLTEELVKWCKTRNHTLIFENYEKAPVEWLSREKFEANCKQIMAGSKYQPRDYQLDAAFAALNGKRGILECCTSSGKSLMIYLILRNLMMERGYKKMLLIVPSIMLVTQMYKDFEDYGWSDLDKWCELQDKDHVPTYHKTILITTWQSLMKQSADYFEDVNVAICDECHGLRGVKLSTMMQFCINADFKIGTTGTLPTSLVEKYDVKSVLGNTLYKITSEELIQRGFLTDIIVANLFLQYPIDFIKENQERTYPEEVRLVEEYEDRMKILSKILDSVPKNHNMLVLCNHVEHLEATIDYLKEHVKDRKVVKITGSVKAAEREFIRISAEETDGLIIVATYGTMSTGVNIKKIHEIVLFANSKSKIKVLQSLGRGLRKHPEKAKVVIYDIVDDMRYKSKRGKVHSNYLYDHWLERSKYYIEQKFKQKSAIFKLSSEI